MGRVDLVLMLPADTRAPAAVRATLNAIESFLPPETLEDARLLASEVVTNAVRHSGLEPTDRMEVRASAWPDRLRVEVLGGTHPFFPKLLGSREPAAGWGLVFVATLSSHWGIHHGRGGVEVWFEIEAARRPLGEPIPATQTRSVGWAVIGPRRRSTVRRGRARADG
jgi:hypothetical protein